MKKGLIFTTALAMVLGIGAAVGAQQNAKPVAAADTTVYCKMEYSWWTDADAAVGVHYWGSTITDTTWPGVRMTKVETDTNVWKYTIPAGAEGLIFTRVNPSGEVADWGAKTNDLSVPTDDKILYTITQSTPAWDGAKSSGEWGTYVEPLPVNRMISVIIDLGDLVNIEGFDRPEVCFFDSTGETFADYRDLHRLAGSRNSLYTVNYPYHSSKALNTVKFLFKEGGVDKWSEDVSLTPTNESIYHFTYDGHWDQGSSGDKWDVSVDPYWNGSGRVQGGGDDSIHNNGVNFTLDYATATGKVTYEIIDASDNVQIFLGKWGFGAVRATSIAKYATNFNLNGFKMNETGTYDFIWHNDYSDDGIIEIRKHGTENTYIYYVLENDNETNDYIYSWGAAEQFGAWPGTQIKLVTNVEVVSGVLHFQGGDAKKIYKIPVTIGYPSTGDTTFKFNNNDDWESDAFDLYAGAAYWYAGGANKNAGLAIDFLVYAEGIRNAAADYSVCNVSKANATLVVNAYNALDAGIRETYVDGTTVYTHKRDGSAGEELVAYRLVVEQLAKIAGVNIAGASPKPIVAGETTTVNNATMIAIVSIIALVSISSMAVLIVIKKRKHN